MNMAAILWKFKLFDVALIWLQIRNLRPRISGIGLFLSLFIRFLTPIYYLPKFRRNLQVCSFNGLFKHEYRRPTLTSRCDVISDVINIKSTFSGTISDDLSISDVKMNLSKIFRNFQNGRHFEVRAIFQTGSCTATWVLHKDRPCSSISCELLFDVLAKTLTELWRS